VINVALMAGEQLSEVVVVGYGTQKTKEVTSAVTSVKSEDFNAGNVVDPIQLIQGKVAVCQSLNLEMTPMPILLFGFGV